MADEIRSKTLIGGSIADSIASLGAVVLAILGLVGVLPTLLLALTAIALGVGFLLQSASVMGRNRAMLAETEETRVGPGGYGTGVTAESIGGLAGVTLGILAILGLSPMLLTSIALLVFGATMILGSTMNFQLNEYMIRHSQASESHKVLSTQTARGTADIQLLAGVGALVLGIVGLIGTSPLVLTFVGFLVIGGIGMVTGGEFASRFYRVGRHY